MSNAAPGVDTHIDFEDKKMPINLVQVGDVGNDWVQFEVGSEDEKFLEVFQQSPTRLRIKPQREYSPESDLESRTPEQTIVVGAIWNEIQRMYY
jgi:hypothetical protein